MGGFVSRLYIGSISDKKIVSRSGFLDLLSKKKEVSKFLDGDRMIADKGFDIENDLQNIGLQLMNIPSLEKRHNRPALTLDSGATTKAFFIFGRFPRVFAIATL